MTLSCEFISFERFIAAKKFSHAIRGQTSNRNPVRMAKLKPPRFHFVRKAGFEPARLAPPPPQDGVSASSTTSAGLDVPTFIIKFYRKSGLVARRWLLISKQSLASLRFTNYVLLVKFYFCCCSCAGGGGGCCVAGCCVSGCGCGVTAGLETEGKIAAGEEPRA